jgi:ribosomal-protein-alanine N-acetyltransferase
MSEISLRNYRQTDVEAMFRLDKACFASEFRFSRQSMRSFAEERGAISLIAEDPAHEIAGFILVHVEQSSVGLRGYVVTLDVAEKYRRAGLAARLLRSAEGRVSAAGARRMELHVFTGNEEAIRFYEQMGYQRLGLQRRFYGAAGLDAFVYQRELADM